MMYLRVHVVKPMFWHIEGIARGSHHSFAPLRLGLLFKASECVQRAAISVKHHVPLITIGA